LRLKIDKDSSLFNYVEDNVSELDNVQASNDMLRRRRTKPARYKRANHDVNNFENRRSLCRWR